MSSYRVYRLRDHLRQPFRTAPHVSGRASVKARDYVPGDTIEATSPYGAYFALKDSMTPLEVGDVLETAEGVLSIFKFVGFEEAVWVVPEVKEEAAPVVGVAQ